MSGMMGDEPFAFREKKKKREVTVILVAITERDRVL
jgi:hypothetical protein